MSTEDGVLTTTRTARTEGQEFIEASRVFLKDDFLPKLIYCLEHMSDEDIWWRPNEQSNSAGNLVLHLCGNMKQWIVESIGGVRFMRDRDAEFATRDPVPRIELVANIQSSVGEVDEILAALPEQRLLEHCANFFPNAGSRPMLSCPNPSLLQFLRVHVQDLERADLV